VIASITKYADINNIYEILAKAPNISARWYKNSLKDDARKGVLPKLILTATVCVIFIVG